MWNDAGTRCEMMKWGSGGIKMRGTTVVQRGETLVRSHGTGMETLPGDSPTEEHRICCHGWESFALKCTGRETYFIYVAVCMCNLHLLYGGVYGIIRDGAKLAIHELNESVNMGSERIYFII